MPPRDHSVVLVPNLTQERVFVNIQSNRSLGGYTDLAFIQQYSTSSLCNAKCPAPAVRELPHFSRVDLHNVVEQSQCVGDGMGVAGLFEVA